MFAIMIFSVYILVLSFLFLFAQQTLFSTKANKNEKKKRKRKVFPGPETKSGDKFSKISSLKG